MNKEATLKYVEENFEEWYVKGLADFVRIPNLTPMVDADFLTNNLIQ